jgi:DNA-binding MltR family transcriptional regulator
MIAAIVENAIIFALRKRFWEEPPFNIERLLDPPGPLSSFYGCIEMGFALGAFGPITYNDLHVVRRIRNGFAHAMVPLNFDTPEVVLELDELQLLKLVKSQPAMPFDEYRTPTLIDFIAHGMTSTSTNREKFTVTCRLLWDRIIQWGGGDFRNQATKLLLP